MTRCRNGTSEQKAMAVAPADWAAYWRARQTLSSYPDANPPPNVTLAAGESLINAIVSDINSYIEKANEYVAYGIVNAATIKYDCGPSQSVPVPP